MLLFVTWSGTGCGGAAAAHSQYCCLEICCKIFQNITELTWCLNLGIGINQYLGTLGQATQQPEVQDQASQAKILPLPWDFWVSLWSFLHFIILSNLCKTAEKESGKLYSLTTLNKLELISLREVKRLLPAICITTYLSWSCRNICCRLEKGDTKARCTDMDLRGDVPLKFPKFDTETWQQWLNWKTKYYLNNLRTLLTIWLTLSWSGNAATFAR